jgi:hypothetical protein
MTNALVQKDVLTVLATGQSVLNRNESLYLELKEHYKKLVLHGAESRAVAEVEVMVEAIALQNVVVGTVMQIAEESIKFVHPSEYALYYITLSVKQWDWFELDLTRQLPQDMV